MSPRSRSDRWRLHAALGVGLTICLVGFAVELHRGLAGHLPAWVYVAEWPVFAVVGTLMWWRLLRDDEPDRPDVSALHEVDVPAASDDPELAAWQAYVARLEAGTTGDQP